MPFGSQGYQEEASQTINAGATAGVRASTFNRSRFGLPNGILIQKDDVSDATLRLRVNSQIFLIDGSVVSAEFKPREDIIIPFGGVTLENLGASNATAVNVFFHYKDPSQEIP